MNDQLTLPKGNAVNAIPGVFDHYLGQKLEEGL